MDIAEIIRQRISKLQKLEELARDPEMADVMKEIGRAVAMVDGQSTTLSAANQGTPAQPKLTTNAPPVSTLGPKAAVQSALPAFINKQFTHNDVLKELASRGYRFNAKNAPVTVSGILKRLVDEGLTRKIEGKSGPNGATLYDLPPGAQYTITDDL